MTESKIHVLSRVRPELLWEPKQRGFTTDFLKSKTRDGNGPSYEDLTEGENSVLLEAQRILGRCLPPEREGRSITGLVVGYVQSGKTLSFETVIALSRDNGYGLVIVLAGTKNNLLDQSEERLKRDFALDEGDENWFHLHNPNASSKTQIENKISAWKRNSSKKSLLVTVLKHGGHLEALATVLSKIELNRVPALIIDDESDQASLNTKAARIRAGRAAVTEVSTTYGSILQLRDALPHHSYLQYTATPQANLLLAQADFLNPDFAELVTPGEAYTGGKLFFKERPELVVEIPSSDLPTADEPLLTAPKSLLAALRYFLLASSHHSLTRERGRNAKDRNRSMMVHPAFETPAHKEFKRWVENSLKTLRSTVESLWSCDRDAVERLFSAEYASLRKTFPHLLPLSRLVDELVDDAFGEIDFAEVNGTKDAEKKVNWKATRYWILFGGAKLDRGYTIEGLVTTYMPRPLSNSANADTLQQRARFFGYKASYLGLCRVFVPQPVRAAFSEYIEHEEFVRNALLENRGKPLSEWRRDFVLTELLKPTRPNVIGLGIRRVPASGWLVPSCLQYDEAAVIGNRTLLRNVLEKWESNFQPRVNAAVAISGLKDSPHDALLAIPLLALMEDFLLRVQVRDGRDSQEHSSMLIALAEFLRVNPALTVTVFLMNRLKAGYRSRIAGRGRSASDKYAPINQYFSQSAGVKNDRDYLASDGIALQLRIFDLGTEGRAAAQADIKGVPWFALHVPAEWRKSLWVENRG